MNAQRKIEIIRTHSCRDLLAGDLVAKAKSIGKSGNSKSIAANISFLNIKTEIPPNLLEFVNQPTTVPQSYRKSNFLASLHVERPTISDL